MRHRLPGVRADKNDMKNDGESAGTEGGLGPLAPEHYEELAAAGSRSRALDRAAAVASFNAWGAAIFAVLGLPFALFSPVDIVLCLGLAVIAWREFKGRRLLKALDRAAPRLLGFNQIGLACLIAAYCLFNIILVLTQPGPYAAAMASQPDIAQSLGPIENLYKTCSLAIYGGIIVLSLLFQGGTAWYYFSRAKHLDAYLAETPEWIVRMEKEQEKRQKK